jgi:hypothetical protein
MDNDMHAAQWRKSTYSNGSGACVEVGHATGRIAVRDTKDHGTGPVLRLSPDDWARLLKSVKG